MLAHARVLTWATQKVTLTQAPRTMTVLLVNAQQVLQTKSPRPWLRSRTLGWDDRRR